MFCKWCGNNISGKTVTVCPVCGKEQSPLMSGNGFWDLCTIDPATGSVKVLPVSEVTSEEKSETHYHIERNDGALPGDDDVVSIDRITKRALLRFIGKRPYVELCVVIVLFLNLIIGVLNLIYWPILFSRQMEQYRVNGNTFMEEKFSDIRNVLNGIVESRVEDKEASVSQSPKDTFGVDEMDVFSEENDASEETDVLDTTNPNSRRLNLTRYIVNEENGLILYSVEDIPDQIDTCSYYWEKSEDGGETWVPLSSGSRYLVLSAQENEQYRVIVSGQKIYLAYFTLSSHIEQGVRDEETQ